MPDGLIGITIVCYLYKLLPSHETNFAVLRLSCHLLTSFLGLLCCTRAPHLPVQMDRLGVGPGQAGPSFPHLVCRGLSRPIEFSESPARPGLVYDIGSEALETRALHGPAPPKRKAGLGLRRAGPPVNLCAVPYKKTRARMRFRVCFFNSFSS